MTADETQRYARQILVGQIGRAGQERFLAARLSARGSGPALAAAAAALLRAGVHVDVDVEAQPEVDTLDRFWVSATAFADQRLACSTCLSTFFGLQPAAEPEERDAISAMVGAALASEVLLGLLSATRPPVALSFAPAPKRARVAREGCTCRT